MGARIVERMALESGAYVHWIENVAAAAAADMLAAPPLTSLHTHIVVVDIVALRPNASVLDLDLTHRDRQSLD